MVSSLDLSRFSSSVLSYFCFWALCYGMTCNTFSFSVETFCSCETARRICLKNLRRFWRVVLPPTSLLTRAERFLDMRDVAKTVETFKVERESLSIRFLTTYTHSTRSLKRVLMSRIPIPSHTSSHTPPTLSSSPSFAQLPSNNMSSRPSTRRPESVYSSTGSYLSSAAPPGTPPATSGDGLAETRKRQGRRDEVSFSLQSRTVITSMGIR